MHGRYLSGRNIALDRAGGLMGILRSGVSNGRLLCGRRRTRSQPGAHGVNGIDQTVIAAESDGEAVWPPLKLLALVWVRQHISDGLDGFLPYLGAEAEQVLFERTGVATLPVHARADREAF
jgi:hypothetical protein